MHTAVRQVAIVALVLGLIAAGPGGTLGLAGAASQQSDCSFPMTATDATGTEVTVEQEPETVVTLAPSAAQTMWEIGAKDKVIGVSQRAAYLDGAETRANISGSGNSFVSVERVVEQDPDLVLAPNIIQDGTVEKLREAGLTVYRFEAATSLEDVTEKTLLIGQLTGSCEGAQERVEEMQADIDVVRQATEGEDRPKVLYYLGPGGFTAGSGTFIHSLIEAAGGTNIAAEAGITGYQQISPETVVEQDPDYIVYPSNFEDIQRTDALNSTTAVQEDNLVVVRDDYMNQPAPRTVQPLRTMAEAFHPEAYAEAVANQQTTTTDTDTTTTNDETTETTTADETTDDTTEQTPTETPGFGVLGAGLALLLVTLMRRSW